MACFTECQRRNQNFILKHKTMFGQHPVEKFSSFYSIYSVIVGSYHEILYTNCHVTQIQQQDIQLVRDQNNEWMQSYIHTPSKYYKNTNEFYTFAVVRQIWSSGQYWKCLQFCWSIILSRVVFMGKKITKLEFSVC